ncbi:hypothetical protein GCM10011409_45300 [Lentibacillus populi]|uniref:Uncharacterized protein n=1 Tax=Lentibacillus populi TaxID=1827502 RepID=A0A9W5X7M5_9BACI|nr:hypothetical protein [Lentibacillus populi]GGB63150.1 hypothetical protein GCM10011409_45300 [Lentibacillus populi]
MEENIHVPGIRDSANDDDLIYTQNGMVTVGKIRAYHRNKTGNIVTVKKANKIYDIDESELKNYLLMGYVQI